MEVLDFASSGQLFFDVIVFFFSYILARKYSSTAYKSKIPASNIRLLWLVILIFCLFPFWGGDYFGYMKDFALIKIGQPTTLEDIYVDIINYITPTYFLFRLFVWGGAIYLLFKTAKTVNIDVSLFAFLFISLYLLLFSYTRVSLAMSIMFYGVSLYQSGSGIKKYCGVILVALSLLFHKSSFFGVVIIFFVLFFLKKITKTKLIFLTLLIPIFVFLLSRFLNNYINLDLTGESWALTAGQHYLDSETRVVGIGERIQNYLQWSVYYIALLYYVRDIFNGTFKRKPESIKLFGTIMSSIIFVASFFLLNIGYNTTVLFYRFITFSMIPLLIYFSYNYKQREYVKHIKILISIGTAASFYTLLYSFYCSLL